MQFDNNNNKNNKKQTKNVFRRINIFKPNKYSST